MLAAMLLALAAFGPAPETLQSHVVNLSGHDYRLVSDSGKLKLAQVRDDGSNVNLASVNFSADGHISEISAAPWMIHSLCAVVETFHDGEFSYYCVVIDRNAKGD